MSIGDYVIRPARVADLLAVIGRLQQCELSTTDLTMLSLANFHLAETNDQRVAGVVGLERAGSMGVLRSVAVAPQWRGSGLGQRLVAHCETAALTAGVSDVYLLTTTAIGFFRRQGYQELSRAVVPAEIAALRQFHSLCAPSVRCLGKIL
ncbi:MAG: family acetyltransferase [Proteobacteria bacterium]|nr:family acetyltransferase [Pseudomonadota bacterium]